MSTPVITAHSLRPRGDARTTLAKSAPWMAAASGIIHLAVARQHAGYPHIAIAFIGLAVFQLAFAVHTAVAPTGRSLRAGATVHAAIVALWLVSRTTGLRVVAGAEQPEATGIPDLISTAFCVGVIVNVVFAIRTTDRTSIGRLAGHAARRTSRVLPGVVIILTLTALLAPHDHDHLETPRTVAPDGHGHPHGSSHRP